MKMPRSARAWLALLLTAAAIVLLVGWLRRDRPAEGAAPEQSRAVKPLQDDDRTVSREVREQLLARAQVWQAPRVAVERAAFLNLNVDAFSCRFKVTEVGGTTPKFDCETEAGEEVRIKYGNGPEIPSEAAATRLLSALGFLTDHITLVQHLRCFGCPAEPFSALKTVAVTRTGPLYERVIDHSEYEDFEWVALERKFAARPIELKRLEGWSFFELDRVTAAHGGAPREHIDAMRLIAVLLAHWDNKSENQRMVCRSEHWPTRGACEDPWLMMQDVGATFGPTKMDLAAWEATPVWEDRSSCRVSMRSLPFSGATFGTATVSEAGRRFASELLARLSDAQLTDLFEQARFGHKRGLFAGSEPVSEWVRVFAAKRQLVSDGPPCPAA